MLPFVVVYNMVSVDGRTDLFAADQGLFYGIAASWKEDATLVGSNTILKAVENVPEEKEVQTENINKDMSLPLLIVPDSKGKMRAWHYLREQPYWRDVVVLCADKTPREYLGYLKQRKIEYIVAGKEQVDFRQALQELSARYNVKRIRVDSGGILNGVLLREGLVNEVSILINPVLMGGTSPTSIFVASNLAAQEGIISLKLIHIEKTKNDHVWLRYEIVQ